MNYEHFYQAVESKLSVIESAVLSTSFYLQLFIIAVIYLCAFLFSRQIEKNLRFTKSQPQNGAHTLHGFLYNLGKALFPIVTISLLKFSTVLGEKFQFDAWLLDIAVVVAVLLFVNSIISGFVENKSTARLMRVIGLPILFLHLIGLLPIINEALASIAISVGNVQISAYGVARVVIFGGCCFGSAAVLTQSVRILFEIISR